MPSSCNTKVSTMPTGTTSMLAGLGLGVMAGAAHLATGLTEPTTLVFGVAWTGVIITTIGLVRSFR